MTKLKAIFTIIRFPNLVFIFLTQVLTYFFLILPSIIAPTLSVFHFILFSFSTVLIATAGYIINDYFDIGIDAINKPKRVTIENIFKRRSIIIWHIVLNLIALIIVVYLTLNYIKLRLVGLQLISILLLLVYSTTFKRKLIIGNFTIAVLTAFTLITTVMYEPNFQWMNPNQEHAKLLWTYCLFAFLITFIREIVKDIEDIKGDVAQNCKTIPLVWGITKAKQIIYSLLVIMFIFLITIGIYFFNTNLPLIIFIGLFVFIPLFWIWKKIKDAQHARDFHQVSTYVKWITLLGILSMVLV